MQQRLLDLLQIPEKARLNQKVAKTVFYENAGLNKKEKKAFVDEIQAVYIIAVLNEPHIPVPAYLDEEYQVTDVAVMLVNLKNRGREDAIARIIHESIPYPLMLFQEYQGEVMISSAVKRLNQNDPSAVILEDIHSTSWIDLDYADGATSVFLGRIGIKTLPYKHLLDFYRQWDRRIEQTRLIDLIDAYPARDVDISSMLADIRQMERALNQAEAAHNREKAFARRMEFHVQIVDIKANQEALIQKLREVCQ